VFEYSLLDSVKPGADEAVGIAKAGDFANVPDFSAEFLQAPARHENCPAYGSVIM
jgi:hypothetical protein